MADHLERIIVKRKADLSYLRRVHEGRSHWLNVAKLKRRQVCEWRKPMLRTRCERWFLLGLSIGRLLAQPNSGLLLRSMMQLIVEYEHFINYAQKSRKFPPFKWYPSAATSVDDGKSSRETRAQLHKVGRKVIFEHFLAYSVTIPLDYCEIVFSLCEVLSLVYNKLLAQSAMTKSSHEAILKVDTWIKTHILVAMSKHLSDVSRQVLAYQFNKIANNLQNTTIDSAEANSNATKSANVAAVSNRPLPEPPTQDASKLEKNPEDTKSTVNEEQKMPSGMTAERSSKASPEQDPVTAGGALESLAAEPELPA
uniref:Uncharacterized protein n=1 Tax=Lotharella globosa TaxID=91324 RepID=A0A7S4DWA0_9EUKA|mmetsp:Transcript_28343/g.55177  ORF Transcript_28343/g.55177 Transcript_28343/m.55177 type:complete len:310 (+) Transcript_28343:28-957(+)